MTLAPELKWAERPDRVFVTIDLADSVKPEIKIDASSFHLDAQVNGKHYRLDFDFKDLVDPQSSSFAVRDRAIEVLLMKATPGPFWHSLLKDKNRYKNRVKIDWDLWKDEDEVDDDKQMGNFGFDGFDGMDSQQQGGDSDDEDLPDLEEAPQEEAGKAKDESEEQQNQSQPPQAS